MDKTAYRRRRWYRAGGRLSPEDVGEQYADQAVRAVATRKTLSRLDDETLTFERAKELFKPVDEPAVPEPGRRAEP